MVTLGSVVTFDCEPGVVLAVVVVVGCVVLAVDFVVGVVSAKVLKQVKLIKP